MQDASITPVVDTNPNSTYEIRSRNPNRALTPFLDVEHKGFEHWEVLELNGHANLPELALVGSPIKNRLIRFVVEKLSTGKSRVRRFLEVYDQNEE